MNRPVILSVETLFQGWGRYLRAEVRFGDGPVFKREIEDHGDAAAVLPYDPDRKVAMLVVQPRIPPRLKGDIPDMHEAPAGLLEGDEPRACAIKEAKEEVGLALTELEGLGSCSPMPGISTERIHLFLAPYGEADRIGSGGGNEGENENITVVEMPLAELAAMADGGRLPDLKTLALVQTLRIRRPELFRT